MVLWVFMCVSALGLPTAHKNHNEKLTEKFHDIENLYSYNFSHSQLFSRIKKVHFPFDAHKLRATHTSTDGDDNLIVNRMQKQGEQKTQSNKCIIETARQVLNVKRFARRNEFSTL